MKIGDKVQVMPRVSDGAYDGAEGVYIVVGFCGLDDLYLARPGDDEWCVIVHKQRIKEEGK